MKCSVVRCGREAVATQATTGTQKSGTEVTGGDAVLHLGMNVSTFLEGCKQQLLLGGNGATSTRRDAGSETRCKAPLYTATRRPLLFASRPEQRTVNRKASYPYFVRKQIHEHYTRTILVKRSPTPSPLLYSNPRPLVLQVPPR